MRKPTMWFPSRSDTNELYKHRRWLEASNSRFRKYLGIVLSWDRVAKTKALINFAVSAKLICAFAKLICAFVFAYVKCWFSPDFVAQIIPDAHARSRNVFI